MLTTPYTYLIGWPEHNRWYYGVRYAKGCHPNDFWVSYFTSSFIVKDFVAQYGEPSIKRIRQTFDSIPKARLWETKLLKRVGVVSKDMWLNKNDKMAPPILAGDLNPMRNPEIAKRSGEAKRGQKKTEEWKANHSATMAGRKQTIESNEKRKATMLSIGEAHSSKTAEFREARSKQLKANNPMSRPEVKAKQSANRKGKPWSEARRLAQINKMSKM